ncbi:hypothetical protein ALC57_02367 [Trachymyrmex cornetzi]|uniref:Uncharacterized protein n=1 Tax=Trachymyrmex cornetzi TaxID=471704 RepID=A0A195EJJ2_9HYME|nr:hypothetical protein ALC57_02367 [Trachymyrmex cornetzi]
MPIIPAKPSTQVAYLLMKKEEHNRCFVKLPPSSGLVRSLTGKVYLSMASSHTIIPMYYFLLY